MVGVYAATRAMPKGMPWWVGLLGGVLTLLGALLVVWFLQAAVRRLTISAGPLEVRVGRRGLLGWRRWRWRRADVVDVEVDIRRSGRQDYDLASLMVVLAGGERVRVFRRYGSADMLRVRDAARVLIWPERVGVA